MQPNPSLSLLSHYHSAAPELQPDDIRTESAFRAACARRCADSLYSDLPLIRRIAAPGALGFRFGGDTQDDRVLTNFLIKCFRAGIRVSPDFEIDCINFLHKRDFLAEAWPYDAVAVCFIVGFGSGVALNNPLKTFDPAYTGDAQGLGFTLSPVHTLSRWQQRIRSTGARFVMTYGSGDEINTRDLESANNFVTLLESTTSSSMFNQGYLAHPSFIEAYRIHPGRPLDPATLLGNALCQPASCYGLGAARIDAVFNQLA